jgi:hypothetical protein
MPEHALGGFAHRGEGFGQHVVERLRAFGQPGAELDGLLRDSTDLRGAENRSAPRLSLLGLEAR